MDANNPRTFNIKTISESSQISGTLKKYIVESQKISVLVQIIPEIFHKLKNKITPILGYTQLLSYKVENESIKERLSRIEKNTEELGSLLDQLSGYFRNGMFFRFKTNINEIVSHMKSYFAEIEQVKPIKIEIDIDENIPDDDLIFGQIESLITNVVDNAVQAIEKKGSNSDGSERFPSEPGFIQIKTKSGEGHYKLTIKDNGAGIRKENLSKIWIPFYSEFEEKAGLGLLLCEKIVKNHDASIRLNTKEGAGTEVEITFKHKV